MKSFGGLKCDRKSKNTAKKGEKGTKIPTKHLGEVCLVGKKCLHNSKWVRFQGMANDYVKKCVYMYSPLYRIVFPFRYRPKNMPSSTYLSASDTHIGNWPVAKAV